MALCSSCQNILPQSAVRCPVCGNAPGISADEFIASLDSSTSSGYDDGSPSSWSIDDRPENDRDDEVPAGPTVAPNGRVFTPPPIGSSPIAGSSGNVSNDRSGNGSEHGPGPFPRRRGSHRVGTPPAPVSVDPFEDTEDVVRTVRAISNRLDADIRIGRRAGHNLFITAAPIAAAVALIFATYSAYAFVDLERPDRLVSVTETAQPGTLAFGAEQSNAAQRRAEQVSAQVHELVSVNCGLPVTANAIAISPTRLVANANSVENDAHPIIRFADGTSRVGTVVGLDRRTDLVVIEIAPVEGTGNIEWGVTDRVLDNPLVVVVERFGAAINGMPAAVDEIDGVRGLINTFGFSGSSFRPGSAVLNSEGFIIGMVDDTGRSAIGGNQLSAAFGRVIAQPSPPAISCVTDEAVDESLDGAESTTSGAAGSDGTTASG